MNAARSAALEEVEMDVPEADGRRLPVVRLVEARAAERPEALAVASPERQIRYGQLDAFANRLARVLAAAGVGRETLAALALPRSPELVVAALATWKAGGAYVPLDPTLPDERLLFMLEDAGVRALVATHADAERLSGPWETIAIDADALHIASQPATPFVADVSPQDLAYVIYTSGTTGRPKGVEIRHESLSNLVGWHLRAFDLSSADRATQLAGVGFDAAVWEIWPALAAGASLHLPDDVTRVTPELLREWLVASRITVSFLPTPLAEAVLALDWPEETALRVLLTGADTLHRYAPAGLPFVLVNNYGPTEAAVVATSGVVPVEPDAGPLPSIGSPIDGTFVRLLDERLEDVADGEAGELCIGGVCLARGYRARELLTSEKFIADPLAPGGRLYRTGDLARRLPDGRYSFLGRLDGQLKVRGHRIESDELVSLLNGHPAVAASAVDVRRIGGDESEPTLVAWIVPAPGCLPAADDLMERLSASVPSAVLPETWVRLDALPLTPNGKLDRAALPAPASTNLLPRAEAESPSASPVEERLRPLVASLLGLPDVGRDDNFFLVGGHSMMGTQLIARVRDAFGVDLTLRTLFAAPTLRELGAEVTGRLEARLAAMTEDEAVELLAAGATGPRA